MLIHEFDELMEAKPFQPFRILTRDGRSVEVKDRKFAWRPSTRRFACVATGMGEGRVRMISFEFMTKLVVTRPRKRK